MRFWEFILQKADAGGMADSRSGTFVYFGDFFIVDNYQLKDNV